MEHIVENHTGIEVYFSMRSFIMFLTKRYMYSLCELRNGAHYQRKAMPNYSISRSGMAGT